MSYEFKVEFRGPGGFIEEREIAVHDEMTTCMWLKLGKGGWNEEGRLADPIWLEMQGMNMLTMLQKEGDILVFNYVQGSLSEK